MPGDVSVRLLFSNCDRVMCEHMWHVNSVMSDVQLEFDVGFGFR